MFEQFKGIIPAMKTPFDEKNTITSDVLGVLTDRLTSQAVCG